MKTHGMTTTVRFALPLILILLLVGTSSAWSSRRNNHPSASESSRSYTHHHLSPQEEAEEHVDEEEAKTRNEAEEARGGEEADDTSKEEEHEDHSEKAGHKEFKAGGSSFDKHLKDHKADNKEVDNVKQHDVGEKFGGAATKEHKLGKHREKSKGHKLHGFKNVYHKEEYGDHKTFHDEFLDTDQQHNYDDRHEHQELSGGKFSKGYRHEGKNKKLDKGDEKREWRQEEFDAGGEGHSDRGRQSSRQRHGSKKHRGQYDARRHRNENSLRKVKKGEPLYHPAGVLSHYYNHQNPVLYQKEIAPEPHYETHGVQEHGHYDDLGGGEEHESQLQHQGGHEDDGYRDSTARNHRENRHTVREVSVDSGEEQNEPPVARFEPVAAQKQSVPIDRRRYVKKPLFQEAEDPRLNPAEPTRQEKYPQQTPASRSHPQQQSSEIKYGYQPGGRSQVQSAPGSAISTFSRFNQSRPSNQPQHHHHHYHPSGSKRHHFRHPYSGGGHQPTAQSLHTPTGVAQSSGLESIRSEDQRRFSQRLY